MLKPSGALTGLLVLCIDDNAQSLAGMQELLTAWGCKVLSMNGGKALRTYCLEHRPAPDVILADYNLGEENGLALVSFAREHFDRDIPAALITADRSDQVRERATAEDISIINKPVRPAILRALLSHFRQASTVE